MEIKAKTLTFLGNLEIGHIRKKEDVKFWSRKTDILFFL